MLIDRCMLLLLEKPIEHSQILWTCLINCRVLLKDVLDKITFGYLCQIITPSTF